MTIFIALTWLAGSIFLTFTGHTFTEIMLPMILANIWLAVGHIVSIIKEKQ